MPEDSTNAAPPTRNTDEVALEMMKFIAVTTGYGKGGGAAGFDFGGGWGGSDGADEALGGSAGGAVCRRAWAK